MKFAFSLNQNCHDSSKDEFPFQQISACSIKVFHWPRIYQFQFPHEKIKRHVEDENTGRQILRQWIGVESVAQIEEKELTLDRENGQKRIRKGIEVQMVDRSLEMVQGEVIGYDFEQIWQLFVGVQSVKYPDKDMVHSPKELFGNKLLQSRK
jgi:hypothetical protein